MRNRFVSVFGAQTGELSIWLSLAGQGDGEGPRFHDFRKLKECLRETKQKSHSSFLRSMAINLRENQHFFMFVSSLFSSSFSQK